VIGKKPRHPQRVLAVYRKVSFLLIAHGREAFIRVWGCKKCRTAVLAEGLQPRGTGTIHCPRRVHYQGTHYLGAVVGACTKCLENADAPELWMLPNWQRRGGLSFVAIQSRIIRATASTVSGREDAVDIANTLRVHRCRPPGLWKVVVIVHQHSRNSAFHRQSECRLPEGAQGYAAKLPRTAAWLGVPNSLITRL